MNRINFQEGVNAGTPKPCTIEQLNALLDSPQVAQICKQIAELDPNSPDYNDRKHHFDSTIFLHSNLSFLINSKHHFRYSFTHLW